MNFDALSANNGYLDSASPAIDPSMFNPSGFDLNSFQNPQLHQRLQNGTVRNASPAAFANPAYQVNPIVPSKRPRPSEDATASPRPAPGSMNLSRSQTPQQMAFPQGAFPPGQQGLQAPNPYQHLQHAGSTNATPSPTMQNQQFRPPQNQHRMQTMSPNPFPPNSMGMSPAPDQTSRVNTPQNPAMAQMAAMNMMQGSPTTQGFNQNFAMPPGMNTAGFGASMPVQPVALSHNLQARQNDAQRLYQQRLQAQQQQIAAASNMAAARQQQAGGMNMLASTGPGMNSAMAMAGGMRPGQGPMPGQNQSKASEAQFVQNVNLLMQQQGLPFNPQPLVCMRPVNLMQLYATIMKHRGSRHVTMLQNGWPMIAQMMGWPPQQFPTAPNELKMVYEQNLSAYETAWLNKQKQKSQQMGAMSGAPQASPVRSMPINGQDFQAQQQQYIQRAQRAAQMNSQPPMGQGTPVRNNSMPLANGWGTPQQDQTPTNQQQDPMVQHRKSMSRQLEATPPQPQQPGAFPTPSPGPEKSIDGAPKALPSEPHAVNGTALPIEHKLQLGTVYRPKTRPLLDTHGGILVGGHGELGERLSKLKPQVPSLEEMGIVDLRAISMSLQSGMKGEVRYALDLLVRLSHEPRLQLELEKCEDLMDALIDCAEEQVDTLADGATEVSDILDLTSYEDVVRNCRAEVESLHDIPEVGSLEYELDRAADRLIAVTTILRNLSFFEINHLLLSTPPVIKFLSNTIRLLATRIMLLRTNVNTLDFMKDIITFLSNTCEKVVLPSREEALTILHFLLAFAPCPPPNAHEPLRFTSYNPSIHRYLPPAIDSLAKLLARDDPNRSFYRQLFHSDSSSVPPYDLLTRTFALAISVVPERTKGHMPAQTEMRIVDARKPYLTQGMLSADILASLVPGHASGLARSWLEAEDGWAKSLMRLSMFLMAAGPTQTPMQTGPGGRHIPRPIEHDAQGYGLITHRALAMLIKLGERSQSEEDLKQRKLNVDALPKTELLLGALSSGNVDGMVLKKLCAFAGLNG